MSVFTMVLVAALLWPAVPGTEAEGPPTDDRLQAGIILVKEGDFEAAVLKLGEAIRTIESDPGRRGDLARAHLYLGVAYLELEQEASARGKFKDALLLDREMRLDPRQFSSQVIRNFEAVRVEVGPAPTSAATAPPAVVAAPEEKKNRKAIFFLLGGGVVAAGAALAAGGGGGGGQAATTTVPMAGGTTTTSTTTTTTTTLAGAPTTTVAPGPDPTRPTTTTTTTMPACTYSMSGPSPNNPQSQLGASGSCQVQANCAWDVTDTGGFINLTGQTSGNGNGTVTWGVGANLGPQDRTGQIRIQQAPSASCTITQSRLLGLETANQAEPAWTSELLADGSSGQIVLDGANGVFQNAGTAQGVIAHGPGPHRIEALLVSGRGRPGTWRFTMVGRYQSGRLRVIAGDVLTITDDTVVFRLAGKPGERVVFAFQSN